jgi:hypothetical protein
MYLTPPSKDTVWKTGLKTKTQKSIVYKKPTLLTETNTLLRRKGRKRFTKINDPPKTGRVQYLYQIKWTSNLN